MELTDEEAAHEARRADEDYRGSVDDAFRAILEGLRTTLPGIQALFGFLLILPFQASFDGLEFAARAAYYTAFRRRWRPAASRSSWRSSGSTSPWSPSNA